LLAQRSLYGKRCVGYVMPAERSINIDGPDDLAAAEQALAAGVLAPIAVASS
jgi:hypothetical protein